MPLETIATKQLKETLAPALNESALNPAAIEAALYPFWETAGLFSPDNQPNIQPGKAPFSIVIPPPNVTGTLHMGHALDCTLQDILIRYHRMAGHPTVWIPGTDHAGIATQSVVERRLKAGEVTDEAGNPYPKGSTRNDLGKERFLKAVWDWAAFSQGHILNQFKRLGVSPDWSRTRFTLDEGLSAAVKKTFVDLYHAGLIYRGPRIVNWDPQTQSAISDIETDYVEQESFLWHLAYPVVSSEGQETGERLIVATTRPETLYGDVAVAVNPTDERYKHLIGQQVLVPLTGRTVPVIGDDYVEAEFGTGALKITPAHDPNDYVIGQRHNLKPLLVLDERACLLPLDFIPAQLHGVERFEARKQTEALLEEQGYLVEKAAHTNRVGIAQRSGAVIEPLLSSQWFVKTPPLAQTCLQALQKGALRFMPERWTKDYLRWMSDIQDWCISRQLWWGHGIPAWHNTLTGELFVGLEPPEGSELEGSPWQADPDVLDTWFSSGLWPFSTMGWPNQTQDLQTFYPTSVLVTGFDIIFFWVARMTMLGHQMTGQSPFKTVYIHGLIRDEKGQKMSKSKGNTVDPLTAIDEYGCDGFRFGLTSLITYGGQDIKLAKDKLEQGKLFANKLWNASRFVMLNLQDKPVAQALQVESLTLLDRWILSRYEATVAEANRCLAEYRFGELADTLLRFAWYDFCDWYVEYAKLALRNEETEPEKASQTRKILLTVLEGTLKLLHPIMPFVTEALWQQLPAKGAGLKPISISVSDYPEVETRQWQDETLEPQVTFLLEAVRALRNLRQTYNVAPGKPVNALWEAGSELEYLVLTNEEKTLRHFIKLESFTVKQGRLSDEEKPSPVATNVVGQSRLLLPLAGLIDLEQEKARLNKQNEAMTKEKAQLEGMLANESFVARAPEAVITKNKARLAEIAQQQTLLAEQLKALI